MKFPAASELALAQGLYYVLTGLWPVVHMRSFLAMSGPKTDLWLVKTVGLLIAVIGGALIAARGDPGAPRLILAAGAAFALAAIDIVYAVKGVISRVYLLDALVEGAFLFAWSAASALEAAP